MKNFFKRKTRIKVFSSLVVGGAVLAVSFNNCSKVSVAETDSSIKESIDLASKIVINDEALYTSSSSVKVGLFSEKADEVYVTNDPSCKTGGQWLSLNESLPWVLSSPDGDAFVYAKFRGAESSDIESDCLKDSIILDQKPPVIAMGAFPHYINSANVLNFDVQDAVSGVADVLCNDTSNSTSGYTKCPYFDRYDVNALEEGDHGLEIQAIDKAGNTSQPQFVNWIVDKTNPVVTLVSMPGNPSGKTQDTFEFVGSDKNGIKQFECRLYKEGTNLPAFNVCVSPYLSPALSTGNYVFEIRAVDVANNYSTVVAYKWYVDLTLPSITITKGPSAYTSLNQASFEFVGNADAPTTIDHYECLVDGVDYKPCSSPFELNNVAEGKHEFKVTVMNSLGKSSSASRLWYVDTTAPSLAITDKPSLLSIDKAPTFVMNATDEPGSGVDYLECRLINGAETPPDFTKCESSINYLDLAEGSHRFEVRATDKVGNKSAVVQYSWSVDSIAPLISFLKNPEPRIMVGVSSPIEFTVADSEGSGVKSVSCDLNGAAVSCPKTASNSYSYQPPTTAGQYKFTVKAVDMAGNQSSGSVEWLVDDSIIGKTQMVNITGSKKIDVLLVFDFSGSTVSSRTNFVNHFSQFLAPLSGLDWRVGIITAEVGSQDGHLMPFDGSYAGSYFIDSTMDSSKAQSSLSLTVNEKTREGKFGEQGIGATNFAIQRTLSGTSLYDDNNAKFFRNDSAFAVVLVSDENEKGTGDINRPESLQSLIQSRFGASKPFAFNSIIVKPGDVLCNKADSQGTVYAKMSDMTGGVIGNVCATDLDYGSQMSQIGNLVEDLTRSVGLECAPLDVNNDGKPDFSVIGPADVTIPSFTIQKLTVTFSQPLKPGDYTFNYTCLK